MDWSRHAHEMAGVVAPRGSRWRGPVADVPRHLFVPRWWSRASGDGPYWELRDGPADPERWLATAYSDQTLVTQVGGSHADHARPGERSKEPRPTSSSTLPSLVVRMLRHADVYDGADVLDVATGSGYSAALLSRSLGDSRVTSVDVDPYLVEVAAERLDGVGLRPAMLTADATGPLPGTYDRIVSMVSVWPIPPSWLTVLRPGGRLVTTMANTSLIITANGTDDDGPFAAIGRVEWDRATFMSTRSGPGCPARDRRPFDEIREREGEEVSRGRYPVIQVGWAWDLAAMFEVTAPAVEHGYEESEDGRRTALMVHADGSWARATGQGDEPPVVHQGGPRRLWGVLDDIRHRWVTEGELPVRGATAYVAPGGQVLLVRGSWRAWIT